MLHTTFNEQGLVIKDGDENINAWKYERMKVFPRDDV